MKVSQAKQKHTALLGVLIFAAGCASATAKLVSASDVSSCKPLGDVTIQVDSAAEPTPDDRATALQRAAADKGATDVVSDGDSPSGSMHGRIFDCGYDRDGKPPSRSEQRSGF
ncbi:MAG: hypothetical protein ACRELY_09915 [Polyangiaceae bacterium]